MRLVARFGLLAAAALAAGCTTPPPVAAEKPLPPEQQIPAAAERALTQRFAGLHIVANSSGPLQKPEIDDIAVVLARGDASGEFVIALLEPGGHDDYHVVTASPTIDPGCARCSVGVDLARHGLYVHVIRAAGADVENFTYQFAWRDGDAAMRMAGVTAYIPSRADDPIPHSFSASVDMLTGKRTDIVDESGNDVPVHRERQTGVPVRPPIAFDAFSFAADALDVETRQLPPGVFDPAGTLPAPAVAALRERFPQMTVQSQASGSLHGEGTRDIVAVLAPGDRNARSGAAADTRVAVLLGQPDGSVRLGDVSGTLAHDCPTCEVQVQIARATLTVQTTAVDAAGSRSIAYQFAFKAKDAPLRLVGMRNETSVRAADGDVHRTVLSTNLLTGERVESTDDTERGRKARHEQKSRLPLTAPLTLQDFGFDPATLAAEPASGSAAKLSGS